MSSNNEMPMEIWVYKGVSSGKLHAFECIEYGSETKYTRASQQPDTVAISREKIQKAVEALEKTDCDCNRFQCYRCEALSILEAALGEKHG